MRKINKIQEGFTLIELLVTISIIGILAAVSLVGLQNTRASARNARRKADLESVKSALELYKSDCGRYPASLGSSITGSCPTTNTYLTTVPVDPSTSAAYYYNSPGGAANNQTYRLCAMLEGEGVTDPECSGCGSRCYKVTNP